MKTNQQNTQDEAENRKMALFEVLGLLRDEKNIGAFLRDLCTPAELEAMADRWKVVALLKQNLPYRTIHEKTGVSVTTVGRVARSLMSGKGYQVALKKMAEKQDKM